MPNASDDPNLLVGLATGDDAAVYRLNDELAVIQTVDFFSPIVDDPFTFGEIAVANALSDIYAMGGRPLLGLNIVAFPHDLSKETLGDILKGGASKAQEAGVLIVGGHTLYDKEPKYGLAATGLIRPGLQVTNAGAKSGDVLILTKALGTGIISTAGKRQRVSSQVLGGAIESMKVLNHSASDAMMQVGVNACVDVTGFGLVGHLLGMLNASNVNASLSLGAIPFMDGMWPLLKQDIVPGGTHRNLRSADRHISWDPTIDDATKLAVCDAQTSGGLLMAVPPEKRDTMVNKLRASGVQPAEIIGEVLNPDSLGDRRLRVTL